MFIVDDITGDIITRQGDNGVYVVSNLPTDYNYDLYLGINDENGNKVGVELITQTHNKSYAELVFSPDFTDKLKVKKGEDTATYYFDLKLCYGTNNIEDTVIIGNKSIYDLNKITVLPKTVEGGIL